MGSFGLQMELKTKEWITHSDVELVKNNVCDYLFLLEVQRHVLGFEMNSCADNRSCFDLYMTGNIFA